MSELEVVITIQPPFSVDKDWDNADINKPSGSFHTLTNYIPDRSIIIAREGVTAITYTAETS